MKTRSKRLLLLPLLLLLASCKGTQPIQALIYVTNLGIDYQDNKFIVYAQALSFSNVAKSENMEAGKKIPTWTGKGRGATPMTAIQDLYKTSQKPIFLGHLKAVIVSDRLLRNDSLSKQVIDGMNRFREARYNILLYGTKQKLEKLLSQKSIFNLSPLDSLLDSPNPIFQQDSRLNPQYGFRIIAHLNEPGRTGRIPSIDLSERNWSEDTKPMPMFIINGAYFLNNEGFRGWFSAQDLNGLRWVDKDTNTAPIVVPNHSDPIALINVLRPNYKIKAFEKNGELRFKIKVKAKARVINVMQDVSNSELEKLARALIEQEIRDSYKNGLKDETDVLNLLGPLARNNNKLYKKLKDENKLELTENSIEHIQITVRIVSSGKYKNTKM